MKIAIASDHAGFRIKEHLKKILAAKGREVEDFGCHSEESVDYPDYALKVAEAVAGNPKTYEFGILCCGTGACMAIAANKVKGILAATTNDVFSAKAAREHNNVNIISIGGRVVDEKKAEEIVSAFIESPVSSEERHLRRVNKIKQIEEKYMK